MTPKEKLKLTSVWHNMVRRCHNKKNNYYRWYGKRGIRVSKQWLNDKSKFYEWALENGYRPELEIDRIDNDKGYFPDNCRFVTALENKQNTRLIRSNNTSKYRGVSRYRTYWRARINYDGNEVFLKYARNRIDAAVMRDSYVIDKGTGAPLNFSKGGVFIGELR